jgi:phage gpG-like protein
MAPATKEMSRAFTSADKLADFLQVRTLPRIEKAFVKALDTAGKIAQKTAWKMVGHDQPGLWPALAQSTIAIKRKNNWGLGGRAESPLYATGALRDSIVFSADHSSKKGTLSTSVAYGKFHDLGTANMPARPLLKPALERSIPETRMECKKIMSHALEI